MKQCNNLALFISSPLGSNELRDLLLVSYYLSLGPTGPTRNANTQTVKKNQSK